MANIRSAGKRARQTIVRSLRNRSVLKRLRKMQKGVAGATGGHDEKSVRAFVSAVDKAAKRGIIHRNAANRRKARLNKARMAGAAGAAPAPVPAATPEAA